MKRLVLASLTLLMVACGGPKKETRAPINIRGDGNRISPNTPTNEFGEPQLNPTSGDRVWGGVFASGGDFLNRAKDFGSGSVLRDEIGFINGNRNSSDGTGIRFWGDVRLQNGNLANLNGTQQILADSRIRVGIWDEYAANEGVPEIQIFMIGGSQGTVSRTGQTTLTFRDQFGTITMTGTIQGTGDTAVYRGQFQFQNNCSYAMAGNTPQCSGPGTSGVVGEFEVNACGFFYCR